MNILGKELLYFGLNGETSGADIRMISAKSRKTYFVIALSGDTFAHMTFLPESLWIQHP